MTEQEVVRDLATHALSKKGAQLEFGGELSESNIRPCVIVPGTSWGNFLRIEGKECYQPVFAGTYATLPVYLNRLAEHQRNFPVIRQTDWMPRDGHSQMAVPIDAGVPIKFLKSLIDEAYDLVWSKLDDDERFRIERANVPFDDRELLNELIGRYNLQVRGKEIQQVTRRAILLRTKSSTESDIPLGATKIGGMPDLPSKDRWPVYENGIPLAFLGQIELSEIAKHGTCINGLPTQGTLTIFSAWGWVSEDDSDPQTPKNGWRDQKGWTVALHSLPDQSLIRCQTPEGVNSFTAATVEPTPILSLPNHRVEPALSTINWTEDEYERFDEMQSLYRSIQMGFWLKNLDSFASHHLLGGYALFQQEFPGQLLQMNSTMLLQIGSDSLTQMCWGDGGEITFYTDTDALRKGRFEGIWGECQCG